MILKSYYELAEAIRKAVPDLAYIDLDKGQFDNTDESQIPPLPAVLIDFSNLNWQTFGQGVQIGDGTVTIRLGVRLLAQTYDTDPFATDNLKPFIMANAIFYGAKPEFMKPRIASHDYPLTFYHVIEQTFNVSVPTDPPNYEYLSVPLEISTELTKPSLS